MPLKSIPAHGRAFVFRTAVGGGLAVEVNGLDSAFGYGFWRELSFPDVYRLQFQGTVLTGVERVWEPAT